MLEEAVRPGDEILDLRAGACLEQGKGADQHRLVGDELRRLPLFGQGRSGGDALREHGPGFDTYVSTKLANVDMMASRPLSATA
jgi:hypothetical protein